MHLLGVFLFLLAHGASMSMAFRLKHETDRARIGALLALSASSVKLLYATFTLLLVSAIVLAIVASLMMLKPF